MPNYHSCSDINTNPNLKNCYTCLDSKKGSTFINSVQKNGCFWSDTADKCSSFQDDSTYYDKTSNNYDASKCIAPSVTLTNVKNECSIDTDCKTGVDGKCFFDSNSDYNKCKYSCNSDTDCTTTGEKCLSNTIGVPTNKKYCSVPDSLDDNNINRICTKNTDCGANESCRPGFNGVKLCASTRPLSSYSSEGANFGAVSGTATATTSPDYNSQIAQNQEIVDQLFNDIQSLQGVEQGLFSSLEDTSLTAEKKSEIIDKINSLSQMRLNLYSTLNDINGYYTTLNNDSSNSMTDQSSAIKVIEEQLNKSKRSLMDFEKDKNNKIRLIEINSYYSQRYAEHSDLMKITIYTLAPIILLTFLYNKGLLPYNIFFVLLVFIGLYGGFLIFNKLASIWSRDSINYQEYLWSFNKTSAPVPVIKNGDNSDPWGSINVGTCIGANCCSSDTVWNTNTHTCDIKS
jgi:hypothetical protein